MSDSMSEVETFPNKESVKHYRAPKLNCVARNCDDPNQEFKVYDGGCVGAVSGGFIFEIRDNLIKRGYYVHSKTGHLYYVMGVVRNPDTNEVFVLYQSRYIENGSDSNCYWYRSVEDFNKKVQLKGESIKVPRFRYRGF